MKAITIESKRKGKREIERKSREKVEQKENIYDHFAQLQPNMSTNTC